jgi:hypothetical protein
VRCSVINAATLGASVRMKIVEFDEQWRISASRIMSMDDGLLNCHDFSVTESSYVFFQVKPPCHACSAPMTCHQEGGSWTRGNPQGLQI